MRYENYIVLIKIHGGNQMKKSLLALFTFFLSVQIFAQTSIRIGLHESVTSKSGWSVPVSSFASVQEGQQLIHEILDAVDLRANFEIRSTSGIDNAAAVAYGGKRYVLYNPNFINALVRTSGNRWSAVSVLAHEVGHHLKGHTVGGQGSQPAKELEADEFSGFALRKMGATLNDAQSAMKLIASQRASSTHPAGYNRLTAIEKGWSTADEQMGGSVAKKTRPVRTTKETYPETRTGGSNRNQTSVSIGQILFDILGQVLSRNIQNGSFVVNNRLDVMKVSNNKLLEIGKLVKVNNSRFPFMIRDRSNTQLFVDRQGNIVNRAGQYIGLLRSLQG
jgi:hypothetical protein